MSATRAVPLYRFVLAEPPCMNTKPDAHRVYDMILAAARRQVATTEEGQAIVNAGLADMLDRLLVAVAGNASMPIAIEFEDDYE